MVLFKVSLSGYFIANNTNAAIFIVSQNFYLYENWTFDDRRFHILKSQTEDPMVCTACTKMFHLVQKRILKCLITLASSHYHHEVAHEVKKSADLIPEPVESFSVLKSTTSDELLQPSISSRHTLQIKVAFLECQYMFLDSLEHLMTSLEDETEDADAEHNFWDKDRAAVRLVNDRRGLLVLDYGSTGAKLKSKADINKQRVIYTYYL
jgi:hypothetical protein